MHFGNSASNFGGSAVRRPVGHDSAAAMSKLVALLPNYMQIVQNWSEKGVEVSRSKQSWNLTYYSIFICIVYVDPFLEGFFRNLPQVRRRGCLIRQNKVS